MCGRYAVTLPPEAIRALFGYVEQPNFPPRFNIAPTQPIAIVRRDRDSHKSTERHFRLVRWGFVPGFVKDFGSFRSIVNARGEGLSEKPSFRNAFRRRRCLVVADGFYEWQRQPTGPTQPYLLQRFDRQPFGVAGITETWVGADGSEMDTACIITAAATGALAAIHERMPVIIDAEAFDLWLDPDERLVSDAAALLFAPPDGLLDARAIGPAVNKVANDDPSIQLPLSEQPRPAVPRARPHDGDPQGSLF